MAEFCHHGLVVGGESGCLGGHVFNHTNNNVWRNTTNEIKQVKDELNKIYANRAKKKLDKVRKLQIDSSSYDIHTLQG